MIDDVRTGRADHKNQQLRTLALYTGNVATRSEMRCRICDGVGHPIWACPEKTGERWAPAQVQCRICGEVTHITEDCKVRFIPPFWRLFFYPPPSLFSGSGGNVFKSDACPFPPLLFFTSLNSHGCFVYILRPLANILPRCLPLVSFYSYRSILRKESHLNDK